MSSCVCLLFLGLAAAPQTVSGTPPAGSPPPALTYEGLVPGESTLEDVKKKLGAPAHEASWYALKLTYPSRRSPGHFDTIHIQDKRLIGDIEAAGAPEGFATIAEVRSRLGEPELALELPRQTLLDYSGRGLRFTFDAGGKTIGTAYFVRGYPRVHSGERSHVSLRSLRQGPQPPQPPPAEPAAPLLCGASEADISPRGADWLGEKRPFVVHDPLRARAAVFRQGDVTLALVGGDIFGMLRADIEALEARLKKKGITHLILGMSHVHSGGDPIGIYGFYPEKFVARIQAGVEEAVLGALAQARPVKELRGASEELSLEGARVEGLSRNARNPGIVDPQVAALQALGVDGKVLVTIAHYACHPEGIETPRGQPLEVSADYPGYLCEALRAATGAQAVFLNGALGGMVSGDTLARSHSEAEVQGKKLAEHVVRALEKASQLPRTLSVERRKIEIPVTNPKMVAFELSTGRPSSYRGRNRTEMFLVRLGGAQLLTIPGELLPEVSFEILEKMEGFPRLIVGLANDEIGYIIPPYDFRAGDYEESMSLGPAAAPVILRAAHLLLGSK